MFYLTDKKYTALLLLSSLRQGEEVEGKRKKGRRKEKNRERKGKRKGH